jgi:acetyl esterase/lipase
MRLIRSRAQEWNIDPNRIGIMGFSAGGEVASFVSYTPGEGKADAADPIERVSAKANFQIMIYPGPLGLPETVPADAPPALFIVANDDRQPAQSIGMMLPRYQAAKVPIEVHLFERGGHAFNMGQRSKLVSIKNWTARLKDWLIDRELIPPTP